MKLRREFTHAGRLRSVAGLERVLAGHAEMGGKWGALVVQLPPSLAFDAAAADPFFAETRRFYGGLIACEPRHGSWGAPDALAVLERYDVAKVVADPERCPLSESLAPVAPTKLYLRLHGSPEVYKSRYPREFLMAVAGQIRDVAGRGGEAWCVFDNTMDGHSIENALELEEMLADLSFGAVPGRRAFAPEPVRTL